MMTAKGNLYIRAVLVKVLSGFQSVFREIMQDKSNSVLQIMFYIDEDSNNSRK